MSQPATTADIAALGTILSVWAHPDDESFTCAGVMATAVKNGQEVVCLTATRGEKGSKNPERWPFDQLAKIRSEEMAAAMRVLGIDDHFWLGYKDGECKQVAVDEAVAKIKARIEQYQPQTIFTFGPDGYTGHDDHRTVSAWVHQAVRGTDITVYHVVQLRELYDELLKADKEFNIFFKIEQPRLVDASECDLLLKLSPDLQAKKYASLCAMPSQTEAMVKKYGPDMIHKMFCCEAFVKAK